MQISIYGEIIRAYLASWVGFLPGMLMTEYQITIKQMQILRFFYFDDDFQNSTW